MGMSNGSHLLHSRGGEGKCLSIVLNEQSAIQGYIHERGVMGITQGEHRVHSPLCQDNTNTHYICTCLTTPLKLTGDHAPRVWREETPAAPGFETW